MRSPVAVNDKAKFVFASVDITYVLRIGKVRHFERKEEKKGKERKERKERKNKTTEFGTPIRKCSIFPKFTIQIKHSYCE